MQLPPSELLCDQEEIMLQNADGAVEASGVNGRMVHINPAAETVVVKLSSSPIASAGPTHPLRL